jgi:glyoxylase I family protein
MKPAGIHHVAICVTDVDAAQKFYTDVLGLTVVADRPDFGFGGAWLDAAGQQVHLMQTREPRAGGGHFAMRVDSVEQCVADIRAAGWKVDTVPHMEGAGYQAFLHDPSGNQIELNQPDH